MRANVDSPCPPVLGRYRADSFLAHGSKGPDGAGIAERPTSIVWRGTDLGSGQEVAIKEYRAHPPLAINEASVHERMKGSPALVKMLAFDVERAIVVKALANPRTLKDAVKARVSFVRADVRNALAVLLMGAVHAQECGLSWHHALEPDNISVADDGTVVSVENCSAGQNRARRQCAELIAHTAVLLMGESGSVAGRLMAIPGEHRHACFEQAIWSVLRERDPGIAAALAGSDSTPRAMLAAVEQLC